jgi:prepilin-type N-terminal cleavage/methylation domain-containing protein
MLKTSPKSQKGFTIIEVLIVLAIGGLILLIVFLAVPALQRNSRNTQAKNAASSILGAVSEFQSNNNGQLPTGVAVAADGTVSVTSTAAGTTPASGKVQGGYTASVGTAMPANTGIFVVYLNRKCNNNAFAAGATNRAVAVGYLIEGATNTPQCIEG